jgi:hypothetical protein
VSRAPKFFVFSWTGEAMIPRLRFVEQCKESFIKGENYQLEIRELASAATRAHFFATISDMWLSLPEGMTGPWTKSPEHLRKWALCKAGYADEKIIACDTPKDAKQMALLARSYDEFSLIVVRQSSVHIAMPRSQSVPAMNKEEFQKSKVAVLDVISELIGTKEPASASPRSQAVGEGRSPVQDSPEDAATPSSGKGTANRGHSRPSPEPGRNLRSG